jgi:hypothetical protein
VVNRTDTADRRETTSVHAQLDRSEARERDLATRYRHIRTHMNVTQALSRLARIDNAGFQGVLAQLADIGVIIGADAVLPEDLARRHDRFGLTLVFAGAAPLIWLNLFKHDSESALADTLIHEAVHSTVRTLGRLPRTPQPDETIASYGEEVVALAGANLILRKIAFPAHHEIAQNMIALAKCRMVLHELGCSEQFVGDRLAEAELAANFFTDFGIDVAPPSLKEIQSGSRRK